MSLVGLNYVGALAQQTKLVYLSGMDKDNTVNWDFYCTGGMNSRTLNREIHLQGIMLMKDMNMNAVRMSHYPPDAEFLDLCDSIGLFVNAKRQDILLHTEMIYGLYDGGHGASLDDSWKLIRQNPRHAGGFLWALTDEGVVRRDKKDSPRYEWKSRGRRYCWSSPRKREEFLYYQGGLESSTGEKA